MSNDTTPENSPQEEFSIGDLLRTEREKKGISKSHLAEIIKVREQAIDALENEDWDKLPARVFIKGFIRSYTISIGYDTKKALTLFDKSAPSGGEDSPVPLAAKKKKSWTMYYAVPILIILAIAIYLFTVMDKDDNDIQPDHSVSETSLPPVETDAGQEEIITGQIKPVETVIPEESKETAVKKPEIEKTTPPEPENEIIVQEKPLQTSEEKEEQSEETAEAVTPVETTVPDENNIVEKESETVTTDILPTDLLSLSATVKLRTYVRIIVDDNPPKEFIFQPGTNPDWTAERGFEVRVGNAAGIEFEFNGEKIENIGDMGKVKTLRFPDDFETNWEEE